MRHAIVPKLIGSSAGSLRIYYPRWRVLPGYFQIGASTKTYANRPTLQQSLHLLHCLLCDDEIRLHTEHSALAYQLRSRLEGFGGERQHPSCRPSPPLLSHPTYDVIVLEGPSMVMILRHRGAAEKPNDDLSIILFEVTVVHGGVCCGWKVN